MIRATSLTVSASAIFLFAGCAGNPPDQYRAPEQNKVKATSNGEEVPTHSHIELTKFLVINPIVKEPNSYVGWTAGTYTRLLVRGNLEANGVLTKQGNLEFPQAGNQMKYESRGWLQRALVGKESATNLSLLFKVDTHEQVVSLLTLGRQSSSNGQKWERMISHSDYSFPYFLVKGDGTASTPKLTIKLKSDNTYQSQGFAAALSVALQVADKLVNEPIVVNVLASPASGAKAKAADAAISQLFGNSIIEQHSTDRDLESAVNTQVFTMGRDGVKVQLMLPIEEGDYKVETNPVGYWSIGFDDPKPSIFSPVRLCKASGNNSSAYCASSVAEGRNKVKENLEAHDVLSFKLTASPSPRISMAEYLKSTSNFQSSPPLFATTDAAIKKRAYDTFCNEVVRDVVALGLNNFDGRVVLWAVMESMPTVITKSTVPVDSDCKVLANLAS